MVAINNSIPEFRYGGPELRLVEQHRDSIRRARRESRTTYLALKVVCLLGVSVLLLLAAFSLGISRGLSTSNPKFSTSHGSRTHLVTSSQSINNVG